MGISWMAWTWPTALFFLYIFGSIAAMGIWEYYSPGGNPRRGIFALDTTRGDRLFITHLGTCFIFLGLARPLRRPPLGRPRAGADLGLCGFQVGVISNTLHGRA